MQEKLTLFQSFSNERLIEIVKNAEQFGYDDNTRNVALQVLKERNIDEEDLRLTGNLTNYKFDYARGLYRAYNTNSKIAFVAYVALLILKSIVTFHLFGVYQPGTFYSILFWIIFILYVVTLIKSFFNYLDFYKATGKNASVSDQVMFFILGIPFYFFLYFFYKSRMKEEMQMIG